MIRAALLLSTFASVFLFPYPLTLVLSFAAGIYVPLTPLAAGIVTDLYYHVRGASALPLGTLWGLSLTLLAVVVRRFVKARIIG